MTRTPPRLPRPGMDQRSFRRPPLPRIMSPAVGRAANTYWSARYSSSVKRLTTCRVNTVVSMMTILRPSVRHWRTTARQPARGRPPEGVDDMVCRIRWYQLGSNGTVQVPARDRVRHRAAEDKLRQAPTCGAARVRAHGEVERDAAIKQRRAMIPEFPMRSGPAPARSA